MPSWTRKILLLSMSLVASVAGVEMLFVDHRSTADMVFERFGHTASSATVLWVGNSHIGAVGESALYREGVGANLSFGGLDLFNTWAILRTALHETEVLEAVVVGLDYDQMGYDLSLSDQRWRERQLFPHTGLISGDSWGDRLMIRSPFLRSNRAWRSLLPHHAPALDARRFVPVTQHGGDPGEACARRAREHSRIHFDPALIDRNLAILDSIVDLGRRHRVRLILLNTPKQSCYIQAYAPDTRAMVLRALEGRSSRPGFEYVDLFDDLRFDTESFLDFDHLAPTGVEGLRAILADTLRLTAPTGIP